MKIDAHQHFWNYDPVQFPWMKAGVEMLHQDFGPKNFRARMDKKPFEAKTGPIDGKSGKWN